MVGLVLGVSRVPTPRGPAQSSRNLEVLSIYAYILFSRRTTKFDVVTHRGLGLGGQPRPHSKARGPSATQFGGFLLFIYVHA